MFINLRKISTNSLTDLQTFRSFDVIFLQILVFLYMYMVYGLILISIVQKNIGRF